MSNTPYEGFGGNMDEAWPNPSGGMDDPPLLCFICRKNQSNQGKGSIVDGNWFCFACVDTGPGPEIYDHKKAADEHQRRLMLREARNSAMGAMVEGLAKAKAEGWDWGLHSSWCSDLLLFVARVRKPRATGPGESFTSLHISECLYWLHEKTRGK